MSSIHDLQKQCAVNLASMAAERDRDIERISERERDLRYRHIAIQERHARFVLESADIQRMKMKMDDALAAGEVAKPVILNHSKVS